MLATKPCDAACFQARLRPPVASHWPPAPRLSATTPRPDPSPSTPPLSSAGRPNETENGQGVTSLLLVQSEVFTHLFNVDFSTVHELYKRFDVIVLDVFQYHNRIFLFILSENLVKVCRACRQDNLLTTKYIIGIIRGKQWTIYFPNFLDTASPTPQFLNSQGKKPSTSFVLNLGYLQ